MPLEYSPPLEVPWPETGAAATVETPVGEIELHVVHVPNAANGSVKPQTLRAIRTGLAQSAPGPRILCGDLNIPQEAGHPGHDGREFGFGAAAYVKAVASAIQGALSAEAMPPAFPTEVSDAWSLCAFWEAIKCAPNRPRGEPYAPMWANCLDLLLLEELERIRPRVVLALGRTRLRDSLRPVLRRRRRLSWGTHNGLERDTFYLGDGSPVELFSLNHPGRRPHWHRSLRALNHSLMSQPLTKE